MKRPATQPRLFAAMCVRLFLAAGLICVPFASVCFADDAPEVPSPTYTQTEQQLIQAGFPLTDEPWEEKDFIAARQAFEMVSQYDPAGLPRLTPGRDGLFNRLLHELKRQSEQLKLEYEACGDIKDVNAFFPAIDQATNGIVLPIFKAYGHPKDNWTLEYEREALSLLEPILKNLGLMARALREHVDAKPDLPIEVVMKLSLTREVQGKVTGAAINLLLRPGQKHPEFRARLFIECQQSLQELVRVLPEENWNRAHAVLYMIRQSTKDETEQDIITAIIESRINH